MTAPKEVDLDPNAVVVDVISDNDIFLCWINFVNSFSRHNNKSEIADWISLNKAFEPYGRVISYPWFKFNSKEVYIEFILRYSA